MKLICAWCGRDLKDAYEPAAHPVSHGICEECSHSLNSQMGLSLLDYLDGLGEPVLVVDKGGFVRAANRQASALLKKGASDIEGRKGGEVFECRHARLPGGCGETIHCSGCTIRRAVMDTHDTGVSRVRVPAYLAKEDAAEPRELNLLISTERVGSVVLLRVDEVNGEETG